MCVCVGVRGIKCVCVLEELREESREAKSIDTEKKLTCARVNFYPPHTPSGPKIVHPLFEPT